MDCYTVHKIYNGKNAEDQFEYKLEQAMEAQYKYTVTELTCICNETACCITGGNRQHKMAAALVGTDCLFTPLVLLLDYFNYISWIVGMLSLACCTLYRITWKSDPCCKYQVEYDAYQLSHLLLHTVIPSTLVLLVWKEDLHRKRMHNTTALATLA